MAGKGMVRSKARVTEIQRRIRNHAQSLHYRLRALVGRGRVGHDLVKAQGFEGKAACRPCGLGRKPLSPMV